MTTSKITRRDSVPDLKPQEISKSSKPKNKDLKLGNSGYIISELKLSKRSIQPKDYSKLPSDYRKKIGDLFSAIISEAKKKNLLPINTTNI